MSASLRQRIFEQLDALTIVDPHTHINPLAAPSKTLADIMGYHYYTELAHSAGLPRERQEYLALCVSQSMASPYSLGGADTLARKVYENWWVWMAVNAASVALLSYKALWLSAILYLLFLLLCMGIISWIFRSGYRLKN